jgi:hypothetical protein
MFVLSTMYWIASVIFTLLVINTWFSELHPAAYNPPDWLPMFSAILLVNVSTVPCRHFTHIIRGHRS